MKNYNYREKWKTLLTPQVVKKLTMIYEYRGEQRIIVGRHADELADFSLTAKIESAESSNKMAGIQTSEERLKKLVLNKTMPGNRMECEIAGYRDVLNLIHGNNEHIPIRSTFILQLHRDLYQYESAEIGGMLKNVDERDITEEQGISEDGPVVVHSVSAEEAADSMDRLCEAYQDAFHDAEADPLLLMPMFMLDFLCIHPFQRGNGRMSRLLALLLLYKSDHVIGRYSSLEKRMKETEDAYYDALRESSAGWREGENDYEPFVNYMLHVIAAAYEEFSGAAKVIVEKKTAKPCRVEEEIRNTVGTITKAELMKRMVGVSQTTIQRTLTELVKQGKIKKIGNGRYTKYVWNREDNEI